MPKAPRPSHDEDAYGRRLAKERAFYKEVEEVHDLPAIFHYWSNKHIRPMVEEFGFTLAEDLYAKYLLRAAANPANDVPRFLSVGSGNCDTELRVVQKLRELGLREFVIECMDLNKDMLERGHSRALSGGVEENVAFLESDFNSWQATRIYDGVIANQALHHVVELEHLFEQIHRSLSPSGFFITNDMIGQNGHMRWPEALKLVHKFWRELPVSYRHNLTMNRYEELYVNHDCSTEGFEGIRAQDILPLLADRFQFQLFVAFGNVVNVFVDRVFGSHFDPACAWDREFIDRIHATDEAGLQSGTLTPTQMYAVLTRGEPEERLFSRGLSPADCIRRRQLLSAAGPGQPRLEISTTSLRPIAEVGVRFHQQVTATGGRPPYRWRASGLPPGLSLTETGVIEGRVVEAGFFTPCIAVKDSAGNGEEAEQRYTLRFEPSMIVPPPSIPLGSIAAAIRRAEFRLPISVTGGLAPYRWRLVSGRLPKGVDFDVLTGELTGSPAKAGRFPLEIEVADAASETARVSVTLTVRELPPPTTARLAHLAVGEGWSTEISVLNCSPSETEFSLKFWTDGGEPLHLPVTIHQAGHQARDCRAISSARLVKVLKPYEAVQIRCQGDDRAGLVGWAEIEHRESISAFARFENSVSSTASVGFATACPSAYTQPFDETAGRRIGLGLANPSFEKPLTVRFCAFDETGVAAGRFTVVLPQGGHLSFFPADRLHKIAGCRGYLELRADEARAFSLLALSFHPDGTFSSIPTVPAPA